MHFGSRLLHYRQSAARLLRWLAGQRTTSTLVSGYNRLLMTADALEKSWLEVTLELPLGLAVIGQLNS